MRTALIVFGRFVAAWIKVIIAHSSKTATAFKVVSFIVAIVSPFTLTTEVPVAVGTIIAVLIASVGLSLTLGVTWTNFRSITIDDVVERNGQSYQVAISNAGLLPVGVEVHLEEVVDTDGPVAEVNAKLPQRLPWLNRGNEPPLLAKGKRGKVVLVYLAGGTVKEGMYVEATIFSGDGGEVSTELGCLRIEKRDRIWFRVAFEGEQDRWYSVRLKGDAIDTLEVKLDNPPHLSNAN
jgi:hypothetical protein